VAEQHKPSVEQLGIDTGELEWRRSGAGGDQIEVAFTGGSQPPGRTAGEWVLMRTRPRAGPVLVFTPFEWECFLDGIKNGEFDDARP